MIGPVGAAVTHQLSSFLVMMNSLRLLRSPSGGESMLRRSVVASLSRFAGVRRWWPPVREAAARFEFGAPHGLAYRQLAAPAQAL